MTPEQIAEYADALWLAFKESNWGNDYTVRMVEVALREKLHQEAKKGLL